MTPEQLQKFIEVRAIVNAKSAWLEINEREVSAFMAGANLLAPMLMKALNGLNNIASGILPNGDHADIPSVMYAEREAKEIEAMLGGDKS